MTDTAAEPLITGNETGNDSRDYQQRGRYSEEGDDGVGDVDESALVRPGVFLWSLTLCAGISGLLFGYEYVFPFFRIPHPSTHARRTGREMLIPPGKCLC
jgi:SP family myo-inositol transporter-like MFS transporter 13